ncbi:hypothetical protein scyTo_0022232, partial [Scyliorhinus torazame]|nr:hypothetical protein [Scyliorhinus torazame]
LPFPLNATSTGNDGDAAEGRWNAPPGKELTAQQKEGANMVRKMMLSLDEEGGLDEVFTFRESMERLSIFKKIGRKPMAWPCQLTIGSGITINIVGYKAVSYTFYIEVEGIGKTAVQCLEDRREIWRGDV